LAGGGYSFVNPNSTPVNGGGQVVNSGPVGVEPPGFGMTGTSGGYGGGVPNPNAGMPASSYGSYSTPYSPSTFFMSPDYNFLMSQGLNTVANQTAAEGNALSPAALSAALNYSSGLATTDYNQAFNNSLATQAQQFNMLNALSTGGQVATGGLSSAAGTTAATGSSALAGYGNAGAAGAIGAGNAYSSGINGLNNTALYATNAYNNSIYSGYSSDINAANAMTTAATLPATMNQGGYIINTPS
jgi:hypothetical protein